MQNSKRLTLYLLFLGENNIKDYSFGCSPFFTFYRERLNNKKYIHMLIRDPLTKGAKVNIYTDYENQKGFEGVALLRRRIAKHQSVILKHEKLLTLLEDKVMTEEGYNPLTKHELKYNRVYHGIEKAFCGEKRSGVHFVNYELHALHKLLMDKANLHLDNPHHLNSIIRKYRFKWFSTNDEKQNFFKRYTNDQIIRYIYQSKYNGEQKWTHSLFREEEWLVAFYPTQFCIKKKTALFWNDPKAPLVYARRKFLRLICLCPNIEKQKSDLTYYVTNKNNISNHDKQLDRDAEKAEFLKLQKEETEQNRRDLITRPLTEKTANTTFEDDDSLHVDDIEHTTKSADEAENTTFSTNVTEPNDLDIKLLTDFEIKNIISDAEQYDKYLEEEER